MQKCTIKMGEKFLLLGREWRVIGLLNSGESSVFEACDLKSNFLRLNGVDADDLVWITNEQETSPHVGDQETLKVLSQIILKKVLSAAEEATYVCSRISCDCCNGTIIGKECPRPLLRADVFLAALKKEIES